MNVRIVVFLLVLGLLVVLIVPAAAHKATDDHHAAGVQKSSVCQGGTAQDRRSAACSQAKDRAVSKHEALPQYHEVRVDRCTCYRAGAEKVRCAVGYSVVVRDRVFGGMCSGFGCTHLM